MSRVGKKPIPIPQGVDVKIEDHVVVVSQGNKTIQQEFHPGMTIEYQPELRLLTVGRPNDNKYYRALHGLYRSLINNMVIGVTQGFSKRLQIVGVGYRAELKGKNLVLHLGFYHPILFKPPQGIDILLENPTTIVVKGIDKQVVGLVSAKIRSLRPPEPYKGKGIKYEDEHIKRKAGKTAA